MLTFTCLPSGELSVTTTNDFTGIVIPFDVKLGGPSRVNAFVSTQVMFLPRGGKFHFAGARPAVSFLNPPSKFIALVQPKTWSLPFAAARTKVCLSESALTFS